MAPVVAFNSQAVLLTAANILYAPKGTTLPDETTVAYNTITGWPDGWIHVGYTATPARINYTFDVFEVPTEQSTAPLIQRKTNERAVVSVELQQFDGANLALVLGGSKADVAAGASQKGWTNVKAGGATTISEYLFALEGLRPDASGNNQPVRIFFHRATIRANGDIQLAKAAGTSIPAQITALLDSGKTVGEQLVEIHIITAAATS